MSGITDEIQGAEAKVAKALAVLRGKCDGIVALCKSEPEKIKEGLGALMSMGDVLGALGDEQYALDAGTRMLGEAPSGAAIAALLAFVRGLVK